MSANRQLDAILGRVRYIGAMPQPTEDEIMERVVAEIDGLRAKKAALGPGGGDVFARDAGHGRGGWSGT